MKSASVTSPTSFSPFNTGRQDTPFFRIRSMASRVDVSGVTLTAAYIVYFRLLHPELDSAENWWFGISPEGIGTVGMLLNFAITITVSRFTPPPPAHVQALVDQIRIPKGAGGAHEISA